MPLNPGTRFGPYEILSPLGAGGMGEVYRARDTRLGRDVAIKVLPQHLTGNPEVRARFEREARTVSQLNHPHICTLFDVGREGTTDFLVMELVDGETLAHRLQRGPLPAREILRLGVEITDALDRAHRAGIVHRDLKPANVMLTKSGAKLMDFGLARATGMAGPASGSGATAAALTQSPTLAQPLTTEGSIVGTFQYMSPEQLEGREADARSDIWSLGCVLYEMATGKRPFEGRSQASLIAAILEHEPPPISAARSAPGTVPGEGPATPAGASAARRGEVPPGLERVVHQCLAKDPDERWQSAGDLKRELEWIAQGSASGASPVEAGARPRARRRWAGLAIAAAAGIAIGAGVMLLGPWRPKAADALLTRFIIEPPPGMGLNFPAEAALSPDGAWLAFGVTDSIGLSHIGVRGLGSIETRILPGTDRASLPFWSPDSRVIAYFANGKLMKIALDGTPPVALCDAPDARGGAWSKDGVILFAPNNSGPIARVAAAGGQPVPVTQVDEKRHEFGHRYPQFLPDGRHFLYVAIGPEIDQSVFVGSLDGSAPVEVCKTPTGARFAPPSYLLYVDASSAALRQRLLGMRFDPARRRTTGDAQLLIDDVKASNFGYPNVCADDRGTLVVQHWGSPHFHFDWKSPTGAPLGIAIQDLESLPGVSLSPDGLRFAYGGIAPPDLYVRDLASGAARRLTFKSEAVQNIVWSHDGTRMVFARGTGTAGYEICTKAADGSGEDSTLFRGPGLFSYPMSLSRDGRWLVAQCSDSTGAFDLWCIPLAGQGAPHPYQHTPANEIQASISPDGHWLAYLTIEQGKPAIYVQSFPTPGTKYQVEVETPVGLAWNQRGDQLLVITEKSEVLWIGTLLTSGFQQGATHRLFQIPPNGFLGDVTPDGKKFLVGSFDQHTASGMLEVVLNWPRILEKK